jgi:1-acyl-sn-glycerol-3-phosphate acyltransferase
VPRGWLDRFARALFEQTIRLYYGRIDVTGRDRVPAEGPVILVANHPNSVADACLVGTQVTGRRVNFIAKDTLTRAPVLGWLVRSAGVVGVARPKEYAGDRDLARERNRQAVETCVPRLLAGEVIAIFGEGISTDARHLHVIRRGAVRFGYAAEQEAGFRLGVTWVPVGITYSAKQRFRSDVLIRIGAPLRLRDLHPDPAAGEAEVIERGTERLQRGLEDLVVNIEREDLAGLIDRASDLIGSPEAPMEARVERQQRVARALQDVGRTEPGRVADLETALARYDRRLLEAGLTDEAVRQRHPTLALGRSLRGLVAHGTLLLLNRYGWINSLLPRWTSYLMGGLARLIEERGTSDGRARSPLVQQVAWSTYGGWLGAAIAFPAQILLVFQWISAGRGGTTGAVVAAVYALTLIPSWRMYVRRRDLFQRHVARTREALRFMRNARGALRLQADRRRIARMLRLLLAEHEAASGAGGHDGRETPGA